MQSDVGIRVCSVISSDGFRTGRGTDPGGALEASHGAARGCEGVLTARGRLPGTDSLLIYRVPYSLIQHLF